jgi:arsenate reductase (thioredoxin)
MTQRPVHVLFLCTGNSARSILAEALTTHLGKGKVVGFSAGSAPKPQPNPMALALLESEGIATAGLHAKSWDKFAQPDATPIDIVITVCDAAAGETCPVWPGSPVKVHWGIPDPPAAGDGAAQRVAFRHAYDVLKARITALVHSPDIAAPTALQHTLQAIAKAHPA